MHIKLLSSHGRRANMAPPHDAFSNIPKYKSSEKLVTLGLHIIEPGA